MRCPPHLDYTPPITASHPSRNYVVEDCHLEKKSLVIERRTWFILHHAPHDCTLLYHAPSQGNHGAGGQEGAAATGRVGFLFSGGGYEYKGYSSTQCPGHSLWA